MCLFNIKFSHQNLQNESLEPIVELRPWNNKPYFGRKTLSSNYLNMKGIESMHFILYEIEKKYPSLNYCPILPRLVQFLLWFLPKNSALMIADYIVADTLSDNPKSKDYLFITPLRNKILIKCALFKIKDSTNAKPLKKIAGKVISEMFVGIVPCEVNLK
jgi:hypothetical protein